ncbi:hypothetical protein HFN89_03500 [Rhizobium laguerreae]|nr:hypothetical protein [Rhizobium laguerreae]
MFEDVARKTKYMVYTTKFDRECRIGDLVDGETINRLATHFEYHGYEDGENVLGLGELAPEAIPSGLQVTILVDMSGSLQGRPIAQACYGVLAATLALEEAGASVEVLGYTTTGNGEPLEAFKGDRLINSPGRLSAVLHVVAKEPDAPAARASGSILAIATKGLHRDNLDGEALIWAAKRLIARQGSKKILVLVTDGFEPNCQASERFAADKNFMKSHLKAVVDEIDASHELDFAQVVLCEPYYAVREDMYAAPVIGRAEDAEVASAIGEALSRVLVPATASKPAPAATI